RRTTTSKWLQLLKRIRKICIRQMSKPKMQRFGLIIRLKAHMRTLWVLWIICKRLDTTSDMLKMTGSSNHIRLKTLSANWIFQNLNSMSWQRWSTLIYAENVTLYANDENDDSKV